MLSLILVALVASVTAENSNVEALADRVKRVPGEMAKRMLLPPFWRPPPRGYNATGIYNPLTERCCSGKIQTGSQKAHLECCGTEIRDTSTQVCCNGVVHELKVGSLCCGNQTYNTKEGICCNNHVVNLPAGTKAEDTNCCRDKIYDSKSELCCYDPKNYQQVAVKKTNEDNNQCCGLEPFSTKTHACCYSYSATDGQSYNLVAKEGNKSACCGKKLYDYNTEICCGGKLNPKTTSNTVSCCGDQTYDLQKQICCYGAKPPIVLDKQSETDQCCGNQAYNYKTQLCCIGRVVENKYGNLRCCDKYAMNKNHKLCCYSDGKYQGVKKSNKEDNQCCGSKSYNFNTGLCCYSNNTQTLVKRTHANDNRCCGSKAIDSSSSCCGYGSNAVTYNVNSEICCYDYSNLRNNAKVIEKKDGNACCGDKSYNSTQNVRCCKGNLLELKANESCCGEKLYNYQSQVCCGEKIFEKKDEKSQCCYNNYWYNHYFPYDPVYIK